MLRFISRSIVVLTLLCGLIGGVGIVAAEDWPMLGRDGSRNAVSSERGGPTVWSLEERVDGRVIQELRGIRWSAELGAQTFSSPVVSGGLVWVGTSHSESDRDGPKGLLKCFRVADGKQVYEYVSPKLGGDRSRDPGWLGLGSSPMIEGDRLWLATNRAVVLCLDIGPLLRGEGPPRELWKLDLIQEFGVNQHIPVMGPPRHCSIGAAWKGRIFVTTNNGVDESRTNVPKPEAPSLVCLDKDTGKLHWKDNSPGANILVSQFASPTVAELGGRAQVIVPQSDGWLRSFDPETGAKLWEFDVNFKASIHRLGGRTDRSSLMSHAVVYEGRVYVASGMDTEQGEGPGRLVCVEPTKRGDVSSELAVDVDNKPLPQRRMQAVDSTAGEKAIPNPNSALVWEFGTNGKKFEDSMHRAMGSVAIAKGLVIVGDRVGLVHCFDALTGQRHWFHDALADISSSPLIVDDKVYVANDDGEVAIFGLSADPNVAMKKEGDRRVPLFEINMGTSIATSPMFSNGNLYLASRNMLYAIVGDKEAESKAAAIGGDWPQWRGDAAPAEPRERTLRSVFVPTPQDIVEKMLDLADVKKTDVVFDLGSGDGRIVITAAKKYGCKAVGYEIDKELAEMSRGKAEAAGVKSLVTIEAKDLFTADLRDANVIAVFLLPQQLEKLLPQFEKLKPGVRIVSHQFAIPGVESQNTVKLASPDDNASHTLFLWTTPLRRATQNRLDD